MDQVLSNSVSSEHPRGSRRKGEGPLTMTRAWMLSIALLWLIPWLCPVNAAALEPQARTPHVALELASDHAQITPGQTFWVAVAFEIIPNWHTYWRNPGDSGLATRIDWSLPEGYEAGSIVWPVPSRIGYGTLVNYGYADRVVHLVSVHAPASAVLGGVANLQAKVSWLVCADLCIPESADVELSLPVGNASTVDTSRADLFARARERLPRRVTLAATLLDRGDMVQLQIADANAQEALGIPKDLSGVHFFTHDNAFVAHAAPQHIYRDGKQLSVWMRRGELAPDTLQALPGVLVLENADHATRGLLVEPQVRVAPTGAPPVDATASVARGSQLPSDIGSLADRSSREQLSLWTALLFALLGGLILNLMPCVLPVIFLKALSIVKHGEQRARTRQHALVYTAGVLCTFAALGAVLLAVRAAGAQVGWGFQLQSPVVVGLLALLMFAIGLNLIGAVELGGRFVGGLSGAGESLASRAGLTGSFFTGVLAVVVATPCTAPFMAAALGLALTLPVAAALGIFLALGIGLAGPYLLLAVFPALAVCVPRPGPWMLRLKELLAFPMFASAVWLVWVMSAQAGATGVAVVLGAMVLVAFACWLLRFGGHASAGGTEDVAQSMPRQVLTVRKLLPRLLAVLALAVAVTGVVTLDRSTGRSAKHSDEPASAGLPYRPFSKVALQALQDADRPVFLNMTADWCITCLVNERLALSRQAVQRRLKEKEVVYLKGDWTNHDPEITETLRAFGRSGVPLYVLYPSPSSGQKPLLLPQLLTVSTMLKALGTL